MAYRSHSEGSGSNAFSFLRDDASLSWQAKAQTWDLLIQGELGSLSAKGAMGTGVGKLEGFHYRGNRTHRDGIQRKLAQERVPVLSEIRC